MKNTKVVIVGGIIFVVLFFIGLISSNTRPAPTQEPVNTPAETETPKQADYEVLNEDRANNIINYSILVKPDTDIKLMRDELIEKCKEPNRCNIWFYDDIKAFELDQEYTKMLSYDYTVEEREEWKKKNYVYIADHLIGSIDLEGSYQEYPYRDSFYEELKEGQ